MCVANRQARCCSELHTSLSCGTTRIPPTLSMFLSSCTCSVGQPAPQYTRSYSIPLALSNSALPERKRERDRQTERDRGRGKETQADRDRQTGRDEQTDVMERETEGE